MNTKLDSLKCLLHDIKVKLVLWRFSFEMIGVKKSATGVVTTKCEQRCVICFLHLKGKDPVVIHQELEDIYGKNALSYVAVWKSGKTFSDNDEVIKEVTNWFNSQAAAFYDVGISISFLYVINVSISLATM